MADRAGARIPWSDADDQVLRDRYPHEVTASIAADLSRSVHTVYGRAKKLGLKKTETFKASNASGRIERGGQSAIAIANRFRKGHPSWNKGTKGLSGSHENCRRTQFKKGEMTGQAQHNYVAIGTLRINAEGYLERKVTDDLNLVPARRWVGVHRLVWQAVHGPIPPGHAVVFRHGRRSTEVDAITVDALELVSRGELMRRNSYHTNYPKEVAQLVQLKGALTRKINRRSKP